MLKVLARCVALSFTPLPCAAVVEPMALKVAKFTSNRISLYLHMINTYDVCILGKLKSDLKRTVIYPSLQGLAKARAVFDSVAIQWARSDPRNRKLLTMVGAKIAKLRSVQ